MLVSVWVLLPPEARLLPVPFFFSHPLEEHYLTWPELLVVRFICVVRMYVYFGRRSVATVINVNERGLYTVVFHVII